MKNEIYKIIDSFLTEAKDQNGNEYDKPTTRTGERF